MAKRKPLPYWVHDLIEQARAQAHTIQSATEKLILTPSDTRSAIEAYGAAVAIQATLGLLVEKQEDGQDTDARRTQTGG